MSNNENKMNISYKQMSSDEVKNRLSFLRKRLAPLSLVAVMGITSLVGCGSEASSEDVTFSDLTESDVIELCDNNTEMASKLGLSNEDLANLIAFLNEVKMPYDKQYTESQFMENVYYKAVSEMNGIDEKTEAAIGVMSGMDTNDSDLQNPTDYFHLSNLFEDNHCEKLYLMELEKRIDNILKDPKNKSHSEELFKFLVMSFSEADSNLMINDISAGQILSNDSGVRTITIDYIYASAYPLLVQSLKNNRYTVKNNDGEIILENATARDFLEQGPLGAENTCYEDDDKKQDDNLIREDDPLIQLFNVQYDYGTMYIKSSSNTRVRA